MTSPIRVLIADDQELVRAGFAMVIDSQPDMTVVGQAADGAVAVQQTEVLHPDVVLMDVRMPRMDGIEATRAIIRITDGATRVIILTTFDLDEYVMAAYHDPELDTLTDREREVLVAVAQGLSNQEIADKLFISLATVKTHVAHVLQKIHARDRVQAVVFAYENHVV